MSVRPVTAYVQPHGLVFAPADSDRECYDRERDDALCPTVWDADAPDRSVNLSKRRGDQTSSAPNTQPSPPPAGCPDHDAPGGEPSPPLPGASGSLDERSPRGDTREGS